MRAAIYQLSTGLIDWFVDVFPDQMEDQCKQGQEFYINCPFTATHIINNVPVTITPEPIAVPPEPVSVVSIRQARLQLYTLGVLATVDAAIQQMGDAAIIEWDYATEVRRDHPLTEQMIQLLGWNSAYTDEYFEAASKL